ncbi:MAG: menaquinol oxidoreductase [Acidobacteria bacterium 21-70-11]|nr:MAG: menaquinol oxidoreductase [Acidobacteria bacterium 21-70-11]HQT93887.1 polysulfide reductase NrfD [Thermoanaerobaculaceae bacterium]HQU32691.1 polysulfide reductase NrfD [Thermoanaerobaculaceae bacterium]
MLEKALVGSRGYWRWLMVLGAVVALGVISYLYQFTFGLGVTGLSRNVTWGLYIAQFTFLVGVAASAVMVVLPYYLHDFKTFGKLTILGEFLAISAVTMCMLFIFVDMGQPTRVLNVMLYPTPHSLMFWDMVSLMGYLVLNTVISHVTLDAERNAVAPPRWIKPIIILSIPWAVSIHTVTAFLYSGLAARPFWMTAILAPRFLASAFSAGPALLILFCLILRRLTRFDAGREPIQRLAIIVTYAMLINVFFVLMELFTALYSNIPEDAEHFKFLYVGLAGNATLVPWMWASAVLSVAALVLLVNPKTRHNETTLAAACVAVFVGLWIEKGLGLIIAGFEPSPLGQVTVYTPTLPEILISLGIYAFGLFLITIFFKIALSVRGQVAA